MIIALPTRDGNIDDHFGHCDHYTLVTVDDEKNIVQTEPMDSPEGCGCKSGIAPVLAEKGVKVMLAGNIGQGAMNILTNAGIKVLNGCSGPIDQVVQDYLAGKVMANLTLCDHHDCDNH